MHSPAGARTPDEGAGESGRKGNVERWKNCLDRGGGCVHALLSQGFETVI